MSGFAYYLLTFAGSVAGVFGVRSVSEQPSYVVVGELGPQAEVRRYDPAVAIEATVAATDRDQAARQAFGLLFDYITGANRSAQRIAMTAPVATAGERIAMTAPVSSAVAGGTLSMRFFLPRDVAERGAPQPTDARLHLVRVPEATIAALRYSGVDSDRAQAEKSAALLGLLAGSGWQPTGAPFRLNYDPPFAIPALRRNEAAVAVTSRPSQQGTP